MTDAALKFPSCCLWLREKLAALIAVKPERA
jgi:hypothetical protein